MPADFALSAQQRTASRPAKTTGHAQISLRKFLVGLFLIAFTIRVAAVLSMRDLHSPPNPKTTGADAVEYNLLGLHLAQGLGYAIDPGHPTSFRAPGFPLFLAAVYYFTSANYPLIYILLCLMGAAASILTYYLAQELLPPRAARIAAICCALYPPCIYFATRFDSENLFAPLLALSILLFLKNFRRPSATTLAASGLVLGYCALIRPFTILLMLLLAAQLIVHHARARQPAFLKPLAFACAFALVILPWTLRNYAVHQHFVLIATNGGSTFYGGNNDIVATQPRMLGAWVSTVSLPGRADIDHAPTEYAHDQLEWQLGQHWLKTHLSKLPLLESAKFLRLWLPDIASANKKYLFLQLLGYTPFLLLFLAGTYRCATLPDYRAAPWLTVHLTIAATILTGLIFWGSPRFRDANAPILVFYAAVAIEEWLAARARLSVPAAIEPAPLRLPTPDESSAPDRLAA